MLVVCDASIEVLQWIRIHLGSALNFTSFIAVPVPNGCLISVVWMLETCAHVCAGGGYDVLQFIQLPMDPYQHCCSDGGD